MSEATPQRPKLGLGILVQHPFKGTGRIVGYTSEGYRVLFKGGEATVVAFSFEAMKPLHAAGDPELDRIRQAVRESMDDWGFIESELEMGKRWVGGSLKLVPGREETQPRELPLEVFFKKLITVREKLRVLEQKINNHPSLSPEEKLELDGYISRCYGSLTSFNLLFASKESQFKGQSQEEG